MLLVFICSGLFSNICGIASAQQAAIKTPPAGDYHDASLSSEKRAADLVSRMTLEEKIGQIPNHAVAIPRLGVPEYDYWSEGLHGLARAGYATVFPQAIGMAATWDEDLIHREAQTIAREARLKYGQAREAGKPGIYFGLDIWSPNINIFRDPRWGRGQETYGEDPFLTARIGSSFVRGLQGDDPEHPTVIATPKHFAVHSGPEAERHSFNVTVSAHDLEDTYLPAFRAAIVDAHAQSIMCAYNAVDGQPACASDLLLKQELRGDWHFNGYVTSDCGAIDDIFAGHKFTVDRASASAVSLRAGTDTACGSDAGETSSIREAVRRNLVS
jgi:beta-glucosidase